MNLRNDVSIPMEETRSPSTIRNKDRLPVTFSNYLKILITRFVGEMCWLVFGPISAWIMDFLLFNVPLDLEIFNKEEIVTFIAGCCMSVAVLSYFQLKYSTIHFNCCVVLSHQFSCLFVYSFSLREIKSFPDDFKSNRPQWVSILTMQLIFIICDMIMQTRWKKIEVRYEKYLTELELFQSSQEGVLDSRTTLLEDAKLLVKQTVKYIVKVLCEEKKFRYLVELFMRGSIPLLFFVNNLCCAITWTIALVVYKNVVVAVGLFWVLNVLLSIAFLLLITLCLKLSRNTESDGAKLKLVISWYLELFGCKYCDNVIALTCFTGYLFISTSQVLFIAELSNFVALAATILWKLSSWLNRNA